MNYTCVLNEELSSRVAHPESNEEKTFKSIAPVQIAVQITGPNISIRENGQEVVKGSSNNGVSYDLDSFAGGRFVILNKKSLSVEYVQYGSGRPIISYRRGRMTLN
ncbi:hypothetical protein AKO1_014509 [Acrasis kona]|uniref:DipZ thioredoxin-like C-terminal domain-containing protein n=1 Tax=Acrasis kona TaxID=1008807 RepID=A0AAW2Z3L4_9EUKA